MPKHYLLVIIFALAVLAACEESDQRTMSKFKSEMEDRKLQRITPGQFINFATQIGKIVLDTTEVNKKLIESIDSVYGITIYTASPQSIKPDTKLAGITEAYLYNIENKLPLDDNLQKQDDTTLLYTRPVIYNNSLAGITVALMNKKKLIKKYTEKNISLNL